MSLISPSEMAALRDLAVSGMTQTFAVYHLVKATNDDGQSTTYPATPDFSVIGWNREITPNSMTATTNAGEIGTLETHRLLVPVGTDIRPGDKVTHGVDVFYVQHTSSSDTYQPYLSVAMRLFA